ncbi:hypothetical protein D3C79_1018770 [compost metagenome]
MSLRMRRASFMSMPAVHSKLTAPGMCPPLAARTFSPRYSAGLRASQIARSAAPRRLCRYSRVAVGSSCRVRLSVPLALAGTSVLRVLAGHA